MANRTLQKIPVNKGRFFEVLKLRKCSIRKLGEAYEQIGRTEKTIRRCLDDGKMPPDLLDRIAKYLNIHPDYLAGVYDDKLNRIEDKDSRAFSNHLSSQKNIHISSKKETNYIMSPILKIY